MAFAKNSADAGIAKKFGDLNINNITDVALLAEAQQEELLSAVGDFKFDTEFVLQFIAALIATAKFPEKPDVTEIIMEIPPWWIADKTVVSELMEFLSLFISDRKKKAFAGGGGL